MKPSRCIPAIAPLVLLAHVAEEAPGMIEWLNRHAEPDLTVRGFLAINVTGLVITVLLAVSSLRSQTTCSHSD